MGVKSLCYLHLGLSLLLLAFEVEGTYHHFWICVVAVREVFVLQPHEDGGLLLCGRICHIC